jgi:hypothetical protein
MKTSYFWGRIKKETEKAINIDGRWIARSIIEEVIPLKGEIDEDGQLRPSKHEEFLVKVRFPIEAEIGVGGATYIVEAVDGRRFKKIGFNDWHEIK